MKLGYFDIKLKLKYFDIKLKLKLIFHIIERNKCLTINSQNLNSYEWLKFLKRKNRLCSN